MKECFLIVDWANFRQIDEAPPATFCQLFWISGLSGQRFTDEQNLRRDLDFKDIQLVLSWKH